jgi:DNA topoisomerase-3
MGKSLFLAEKPSVARSFAGVFSEKFNQKSGYMESESVIVTWCVGHLVGLSDPSAYGEEYKKWRMDTLPMIPATWKYHVIESSEKQFEVVKNLLNRDDVDTIYVCTDSGREGEYIYRLVRQEAHVTGKNEKRVWIDSQTEDEMKRGIREAKDISAYDNLAASAYLRAREDWLMGMNFSRLLTLRFGNGMASFLHQRYAVIAVGRVMTCVLGMVVKREREIRDFKKTPFYRVVAEKAGMSAEWKAVEGTKFYKSPLLYKENGFKTEKDAGVLIENIYGDKEKANLNESKNTSSAIDGKVVSVSKKTEKKNPPLLYNLAEIQNDCSKMFKISPDRTLEIIQELYEKRLVTYPRTDARVLSSAVAQEIYKNIKGLTGIASVKAEADFILEKGLWKGIARSRYTDDKKITDHYAIIPTGQGLSAIKSLGKLQLNTYEMIVRRFLAIFLPPALYSKLNMQIEVNGEMFFLNDKTLKDPGYLRVMDYSFTKSKKDDGAAGDVDFDKIRKGSTVTFDHLGVREGSTSPPKRYNSGSMILAMENAGELIEDESLREQIKSTGIGTSATRAGILKKLFDKKYLDLNKKTQIITPTLTGEIIYDIVRMSIGSLLNPALTASWEKGLQYVADGQVTEDEYMEKLTDFITSHSDKVKNMNMPVPLSAILRRDASFYPAALKTGQQGMRKQTKKAAAGKKADAGKQKEAGEKADAGNKTNAGNKADAGKKAEE